MHRSDKTNQRFIKQLENKTEVSALLLPKCSFQGRTSFMKHQMVRNLFHLQNQPNKLNWINGTRNELHVPESEKTQTAGLCPCRWTHFISQHFKTWYSALSVPCHRANRGLGNTLHPSLHLGKISNVLTSIFMCSSCARPLTPLTPTLCSPRSPIPTCIPVVYSNNWGGRKLIYGGHGPHLPPPGSTTPGVG